MISKLRALLSRTRLILKITIVLSIASLLLIGCLMVMAENRRDPDMTAGFAYEEEFDDESSTTTVTVVWTVRGSVDKVKLVDLNSDKSVTIDELGQKASISGLSADGGIKVVGVARSGIEGVIDVHRVSRKDEIVVSDVQLTDGDNNQPSTVGTNISWKQRGSTDKLYAMRPDGTTTRAIYDSGKTITISDIEKGEKIKVIGVEEDKNPDVLQTHTVGDGVSRSP